MLRVNKTGINCNSLAFTSKDIHHLDKLYRITSGNWPLTDRVWKEKEAERGMRFVPLAAIKLQLNEILLPPHGFTFSTQETVSCIFKFEAYSFSQVLLNEK